MFRTNNSSSNWIVLLGLEYSQMSGHGRVVHIKSSTGEVVYDGDGGVELDCVAGGLRFGHRFDIGDLAVAPMAGFVPMAIVGQNVTLGTNVDGAFSGFDWYNELHIYVPVGAMISVGRFVVECEYRFDTMRQHYSGGIDGRPTNGVPMFASAADGLDQLVVVAGIVF
jgi:hypothetical protein